ncbi:MAG: SagB/ThcOx family dehydrogenase [FCB group bacterium]|jgi:SagB-type dehydrogenase family enzyme
MKNSVCLLFLFIFVISNTFSDNLKTITLPSPQTDIGKPLMQALKLRHSSREFSTKPLPMQTLSNLLWAADGINRPEANKRTAPSAMNNQEIDIYLTLADGVYLYNAKENCLQLVIEGDLRAFAGKQDFVKDAPLNLIYIADFSKIVKSNDEDKIIYSAADAGFIAQNVYLYCASEGLEVVVRAFIDKEALSKKLNLKSNQKIILSQTVGYPKEKKN